MKKITVAAASVPSHDSRAMKRAVPPRRPMLIAGALSLANLALVGTFALSGVTAPASAQEWIWKDGACPSGYSQGQPGRAGQSDSDKCYKGSFGTYTPPTYGSIAQASEMDRCPVGYWTDQNDIWFCVSPYQDTAPQSSQCPNGSGSDAGLAIGGNAGAVLGGMLGGMGKKKKPAGC